MNKTFNRIYTLFTSDLNLNEIERLVKNDAPGVYDFYMREVEATEEQNPIKRGMTFIGNLFSAFLLKMHPARRFFYLIISILFLYAFAIDDWAVGVLAFLLLNTLLAFELADKLTAKDELEVAREIQSSLMPPETPSHKDYDIACFSEAAREVGGDYYDFVDARNGNEDRYVVIGDVSGKGMGAALHMVQMQALLQNLVAQHEKPCEILSALNRNLHYVLPTGTIITANMATIHANNKVTLCRAGHMPLMHFSSNGKGCREIMPAGIGLGLSPDRFDELMEETQIDVESGDVLLFYTDGVVEMMNREKEEYGERRLKEVVAANRQKSAIELKDAILLSLATFRGSAPPHDDLTMIIMKRL